MRSMTGFAAESGEASGRRWRWEAKSVNGRGLDLRFRLADTLEIAEPDLRALAAKRLHRGNVQIALRAEDAGASAGLALNEAALIAVIDAAGRAAVLADERGMQLAPATAADLVAVRGVLEPGAPPVDDDALAAALKASFTTLVASLDDARAAEGERIAVALGEQVDVIEALSQRAVEAYETQQAATADKLAAKVAAVLAAVEPGAAAPEKDRIAQELALLAVKADIKEELDRLTAHVAAARDLIAAKGPIGRKLDFLTQEFNREVNTLCSKSASTALTEIGLEMKVVVDQMREQAQNVE